MSEKCVWVFFFAITGIQMSHFFTTNSQCSQVDSKYLVKNMIKGMVSTLYFTQPRCLNMLAIFY